MSTSNFPADYRRAYAEFAEVNQCQVINDGTQFAVINPAKLPTVEGQFWNHVHTWEQTVAAFPETYPHYSSYVFVCSCGVQWVIVPL